MLTKEEKNEEYEREATDVKMVGERTIEKEVEE